MSFPITIYHNTNSSIELTVGLPIYNNKEISWLSIESLCNQIDIDFDWELVVFEETHDQSSCPMLLLEYKEKLISVGCKKIVHITDNNKVPLTNKWIDIAKHSSENSKCYLFHGSDDYSPKNRLKFSYNRIVKENYDWYDQRKVYFYSFISGKVIIYDKNGCPNVNMATKTEYVKNILPTDLKRGIDNYVYKNIEKNIGKVKRFSEQELFSDAIDTHGLNNISQNRETLFYTKPDIFQVTELTIYDLPLSNEIIKKLVLLTKKQNFDFIDPTPNQTPSESDNKSGILSLLGKGAPKKTNSQTKVISKNSHQVIQTNSSKVERANDKTLLRKTGLDRGGNVSR